MGKRKKRDPDEFRPWKAAREARQKELHAHIRRIEAELAARKRPA